jgi:hypothetical protein
MPSFCFKAAITRLMCCCNKPFMKQRSRQRLGVNRRGMRIYAVHHVRRSSGEHPTVAGSAWPVILLLALLLFASCVKACA